MRKERTDLQRFQIGDVVRVTTQIMSRRSHQVGKVVAVKVSRYAKTLDKYVIHFEPDSSETFWDIQLESMALLHLAHRHQEQ